MNDNPVPDCRAIRRDTAALKTGQIEITERLGILQAQYPSLLRRVDRMDLRLDGIERRLDIADCPAESTLNPHQTHRNQATQDQA